MGIVQFTAIIRGLAQQRDSSGLQLWIKTEKGFGKNVLTALEPSVEDGDWESGFIGYTVDGTIIQVS